MEPNKLENRIKEERLAQAVRNDLVGKNSKLNIILKTLGEPIVSQNEGGLLDSNYLEDPYDDKYSPHDAKTTDEFMKNIPVISMYDSPGIPQNDTQRPEGDIWGETQEPTEYTIRNTGRHFDGLSRGMHLEIWNLEDLSTTFVHFKGYEVFRETKGELEIYVPDKSWEDCIDKLVKVSKPKYRKIKEEELTEQAKESEKNKEGWLKELAKRWGIN